MKHLFYDLSDSQKIAFSAPYFGWGGGLKGFSGKTLSVPGGGGGGGPR